MFGRKKPENEINIDSAWKEEGTEAFFDGAAAEGKAEYTSGLANDARVKESFEKEVDFSGLDVVVADERPEDFEDGEEKAADRFDEEAVSSEDALIDGADKGIDWADESLADSAGWDDEDDLFKPAASSYENDYEAESPSNDYDDFSYGDELDSVSSYDESASTYSYDDDIDDASDSTPAPVPPAPVAVGGSTGGKHAAHAAKPVSKRQQKKEEKLRKLEEMPDHQRKSKRQRRGLIAILILLLALVAALVYLSYTFLVTADLQPVQQQNETEAVSSSETEGEASDAGRTTQKTEVPKLTSLFGLDEDAAIEALGHGATVDSSQDVNEEGSAIKKRIGLKLTEEPGDTKSGQPTVYLGLNEDGKVVETSYSTATGYLGYGALSLSDIVENEHIIENTLSDAGLIIETAETKLPENASDYQTYGSDGTTLEKEKANFDGSAPDADGNKYNWSAVLTYDYSSANASGNLADTVRQIYITIKKP